jgi:HlyD family secretion protein
MTRRGYGLLVLLLLAAGAWLALREPAPPQESAPAPIPRQRVIAALGRIEPVSEEIRVAAAMTGRLAEVLVEEGDTLSRGQLIARLENADHAARVRAAEAGVQVARAALERVLNGARPAEREEAAASVREAEALAAQAERELARQKGLAAQKLGRPQDLDNAASARQVALAQLARARHHHRVVDSPPRADEQARAEAELALAQARLAEAQAVYEKSLVRSPIDGVVLRKFRRAGEQVTEMLDLPVISLGDLSRLRIRAEIDEADIALLRLGQSAYAQADAYGERRFPGKLTRIGQRVGRKQLHTGQPAEKQDTRVLEVLIELAPGNLLPVGMRVDAFIALEEER